MKKMLPKKVRTYLRESLYSLFKRSLESAAREQDLEVMVKTLEEIVPDITDQYSTFKLDSPYLKRKARNMHAFQISLAKNVIAEFEKLVIADIGDSSGTHLRYLTALYSKDGNIKALSVNSDLEAVERIKKKGLNAVHANAEKMHAYDVNADMYLCFQTLEHLMDPCGFLHDLSMRSRARYLIATVPYVTNSRVGLHYIRDSSVEHACAERTHIFELSPEDWKLLARHSGWDIVSEHIYLQYPKKSILRITKPLWKRLDFEGFYGLILKRDDRFSSKYADWQEAVL